MKISEVLDFYGGTIRLTASGTGVSYQAVYKWIREQKVPYDRQLKIEKRTQGELIADEEDEAA